MHFLYYKDLFRVPNNMYSSGIIIAACVVHIIVCIVRRSKSRKLFPIFAYTHRLNVSIQSIFHTKSSKQYQSYFFKDPSRCVLHCTLSQELLSKIGTTLYIKIRQQHFYLTTLCIIKQQAVGRGMIKNFIFYIVDRVLF